MNLLKRIRDALTDLAAGVVLFVFALRYGMNGAEFVDEPLDVVEKEED